MSNVHALCAGAGIALRASPTHEGRHRAFTVVARERAGRIATILALSSRCDARTPRFEAKRRHRHEISWFEYHRAVGNSLSYDRLFAALAVLSTTFASVGCSKSESARAVEESRPKEADTATKAAAPAAPEVLPSAAETAVVDAGRERPLPAATPSPKREAPATCGAQGCSPDMKKGN